MLSIAKPKAVFVIAICIFFTNLNDPLFALKQSQRPIKSAIPPPSLPASPRLIQTSFSVFAVFWFPRPGGTLKSLASIDRPVFWIFRTF